MRVILRVWHGSPGDAHLLFWFLSGYCLTVFQCMLPLVAAAAPPSLPAPPPENREEQDQKSVVEPFSNAPAKQAHAVLHCMKR